MLDLLLTNFYWLIGPRSQLCMKNEETHLYIDILPSLGLGQWRRNLG